MPYKNREDHIRYSREWGQRNRERVREKSKRYHHRHMSDPAYREKQRIKSREQYRKRKAAGKRANDPETTRRRSLELKLQVIDKFSKGTMKCAGCDESRIFCLTVDHIHGNGKQHRQSLNTKSQAQYHRWLLEYGTTDDFQILCMNCQWAKRYYNKEWRKQDGEINC